MKLTTHTFKTAIKPILILSITLILTSHTFSQQTFKFLPIACQSLHDKELFDEPLDSIIKENPNNIISHQKFKNNSKYEGNGLMTINLNLGSTNDVLKLSAQNIRLLGKYYPDTILLYFNKEKLYKCVFHFLSNQATISDLYNELLQKFGNTITTRKGDKYGPIWSEESEDITLFYSKKNNNEIQVEIETSKNETNETVNNDHDVLESQIRNDRQGKGDGTFSLSLIKMENIIKSHSTSKTLEHQFSKWVSYGAFNDLGYEYDNATKDLTAPFYQIYYESDIKGKYYKFKIEISKRLTNPINYFEVTTSLNGYQLAMFKKALIQEDYYLNENLTEIFNKETFQNKNKNLMITIFENNGTYTIGIR